MEYSYTVDSKNIATVTYTGNTSKGSILQTAHAHNLMPWTKEEAEQWAEATIQAMKDNNDVYIAPVYDRDEQIAAYKAARNASE